MHHQLVAKLRDCLVQWKLKSSIYAILPVKIWKTCFFEIEMIILRSKYLKPFVENGLKLSLQITLKSFEDSWNYFYLVSLVLFFNVIQSLTYKWHNSLFVA